MHVISSKNVVIVVLLQKNPILLLQGLRDSC